jgi:hypothetical protein
LSDWASALEVRREGDRDPIGTRKEAVYRYDLALYERLRCVQGGGSKGVAALAEPRYALRSMMLRHATALALLLACAVLSGCGGRTPATQAFLDAALPPDDPCKAINPGGGRTKSCEELRAIGIRNALLEDYRKCVDANASDPTRCSAILQGLNAVSINVGSNQNANANP